MDICLSVENKTVQRLSVSTLTKKSDANANMCHIKMWLEGQDGCHGCVCLCLSPVWFDVLCHVNLTQLHWVWLHRHMDAHMGSHMDADIVIFLFAVNRSREHSEMERFIPVSCTFSSTVTIHPSASYHLACSIFGLLICCVSFSHFPFSHIPSDPLFPFNFCTRAIFFIYIFNPLTAWIVLLC